MSGENLNLLRLYLFLGLLCPLLFFKMDLEVQAGTPPAVEKLEIEAETIFYDWEREILILEGNVVAKSGPDLLMADKAIYQKGLNLLELFGNVRLRFREDLLDASYAKIDTERRTGTIVEAVLFLRENNLHLTGSLIEKTGEATYRIRECRVTSCDPIPPPWHLYGSTVEVTVDGYGRVWNASLNIKELPLLYTPILIFPAKTKRQSGLLIPRVGYSRYIGADFELPFFWNLSPSKDFTFYQRYMSQKGYMQGIEFRYAHTKTSKGALILDIMREDDPKPMKGKDLDISPLPRENLTRFWFRGKMDGEIWDGIGLNADLDLVSDQDFLRELQPKTGYVKYRPDLAESFKRPSEERYSPFRTNRFKIGKSFESDAYMGFHSAYFQSPERPLLDTTPQPLLNLFAAKEFRLLGFGTLLDLEGMHRYVFREEGEKGHEFRFSPNLKGSIPVFDHLNLSPYFRYDLSYFGTSGTGQYDNIDLERAFEMGIGLSTNLYRDFSLEAFDLPVIRHNIIPRVELQYSHQKPDPNYPWFDEYLITDRGSKLHFKLENNFTAKPSEKGGQIKRLASISMDQELILEPGVGDKGRRGELGFFNLLWVVEPKERLEFRGDFQWDHKDRRVERVSMLAGLPFKLFSSKENSAKLGYQYEAEGVKTLNLDLSLNIHHGILLGSSLSRDLRGNQNVDSSFWLGYRHQCYGVKFVLDRSQNASQIGLFVELLGLGEIGGKF